MSTVLASLSFSVGAVDQLVRSKQHHMPICTLPVLNEKIYLVNSVALISAAGRSKNLSFYPFVAQFFQKAAGLDGEAADRFNDFEFMLAAAKPIAPSLSGAPLRGATVAGLSRIAADLNAIKTGRGLETTNVTNWLRDVLGQAMMVAVYGEKNPMTLEVHSSVWCVLEEHWG